MLFVQLCHVLSWGEGGESKGRIYYIRHDEYSLNDSLYGSWHVSVTNKPRNMASSSAHTLSHILTHPHTPVEHFFLSSDMWYPPPTSSKSSPDRVAPSHKNCASTGVGTVGPEETSNLACRELRSGGGLEGGGEGREEGLCALRKWKSM